MTDQIDTTDNHLHEARWALAKADQMGDPAGPGATSLVHRSTAHSLVSIAEALRFAELRKVIEGEVWAMLDEHEQDAIMAEFKSLLHIPVE